MLLTIGVSLYTVRVVLATLGVVDYGIYNVVGGIVTMFGFLSGAMASASQRFFSYELGRKNHTRLRNIFSLTTVIYVLLAIIIFILAETAGLWFLNNRMIIPEERMDAAIWVYQFAIISFMSTMFAIPYNAVIIAHERMNVYAWVSVLEVTLKLLIVYVLVVFDYDKLKLYAILMFGVTTLITLVYRNYCKKNFEECRFSFYWDRRLFNEILSFSGWNLFGMLAGVLNGQGINVILNIFFDPIVNASRAISFHIYNAINQLAQNFMTAARPQIIKYYAEENRTSMISLIFRSSKLSYYLLLIISIPILIEMEYILRLWLRDVPEYLITFTRLAVINMLIESISYPLITAAQATGKIKKYQIVIGTFIMLNLPVSYVFLRLGYPSESVFVLTIINSAICLLLRLYFLKKMISFPVGQFFTEVILPILSLTILSLVGPIFMMYLLEESFGRLLAVSFCSVILDLLFIYFLGITGKERKLIRETTGKFYDKFIYRIKANL